MELTEEQARAVRIYEHWRGEVERLIEGNRGAELSFAEWQLELARQAMHTALGDILMHRYAKEKRAEWAEKMAALEAVK